MAFPFFSFTASAPRRGIAGNLLRRGVHLFSLMLLAILLSVLGCIPLRMAIALSQAPQPQAILVLGGSPVREAFTAYFARAHPELPIWISSGLTEEQALPLFLEAGIPSENLYFDRNAVDTVTNFTSLVMTFRQQQLHHLYLVTSDYHMPRAKAIANLVLGSQGIAYTAVTIPSNHPPESRWRTLRDVGRSLVWIFIKRTGSSLYSYKYQLNRTP